MTPNPPGDTEKARRLMQSGESAKDITRPWRNKFFECKDIPNRGAPSKIWDPPKHGLPVKRQAGQKGRRK